MARTLARVFAVALIALLSLVPAATAFAAAPLQEVNPDFVGLWISEESEMGETVSLSFFDDGAVQGQSDYSDGSESFLYAGSWGDNGDDTVSVFIEEVDGESIGSDAFEILFDVVSDTELNAADTTDFGDDGMTLTWEDSEPVAFVDDAATTDDAVSDSEVMTDTEEMVGEVAPGVYVTDELDADGVPVAALVYLNEDGSFQSIAATFDGETLPVTRLGYWEDNGDGSLTITSDQELTVTADGTEVTDLDEEEVLDFTISGDVLEGEGLTVYRLGAVTEQMSGFAGAVESEMDSESAVDEADMSLYMSPMKEILAGTINVLVLANDGTASFTYGPTDADEPMIEVGEWSEDEDGILTVDLTQDDAGEDLDEPATIVFEPDEDGNLTATDFDSDRYGDAIFLELTQDQ